MDSHVHGRTIDDLETYHNDPTREIPPTVDPERPPQRNDDNKTSHCGCPCSGNAVSESVDTHNRQAVNELASNEQYDEQSDEDVPSEVNGEEGAREYLIEVGDFGMIELGLIYRALARHQRCTCHWGVLPDLDDYPSFDSAVPSGFHSPGESMIVEQSSNDQSMASSQVLSIRSRGSSSSIFEQMGTGFSVQTFPMIWNPLRLTPDVRFEYPLEISLSSLSESEHGGLHEEFTRYDLW